MKKGIVILVAILLLGSIFIFNKKDKSSSSMMMGNTQSSENINNPVATNSVSIEGFNFKSPDIKVKVGSKVSWTNNDGVAHTVQENDGKDGPKSESLAQKDVYSFTFKTVGVFHYICSIHPDMTGTVTVLN